MTQKHSHYRELKIDREDMLALTRRMTVKRTSITRIAGAYIDPDGFVDGTFNTRFLNLSQTDKTRQLEIAKTIPFSDTNRNLKRYLFPEASMGKGSLWQLLMGARTSGLENDALLDLSMKFRGTLSISPGIWRIPVSRPVRHSAKGADHERLGESEQLFEYLICAICPVSGDYEPETAECGFLFPSYSEGGALLNAIDLYQADPENPHPKLARLLRL